MSGINICHQIKWSCSPACIVQKQLLVSQFNNKIADLTKAGVKVCSLKVSLHVFIPFFFQIFVVCISIQPKQPSSPSVRNSTSSQAGCSFRRKQQGFKSRLSKKKCSQSFRMCSNHALPVFLLLCESVHKNPSRCRSLRALLGAPSVSLLKDIRHTGILRSWCCQLMPLWRVSALKTIVAPMGM